jgi:hypothetical protein
MIPWGGPQKDAKKPVKERSGIISFGRARDISISALLQKRDQKRGPF